MWCRGKVVPRVSGAPVLAFSILLAIIFPGLTTNDHTTPPPWYGADDDVLYARQHVRQWRIMFACALCKVCEVLKPRKRILNAYIFAIYTDIVLRLNREWERERMDLQMAILDLWTFSAVLFLIGYDYLCNPHTPTIYHILYVLYKLLFFAHGVIKRFINNHPPPFFLPSFVSRMITRPLRQSTSTWRKQRPAWPRWVAWWRATRAVERPPPDYHSCNSRSPAVGWCCSCWPHCQQSYWCWPTTLGNAHDWSASFCSSKLWVRYALTCSRSRNDNRNIGSNITTAVASR